MSCRAGLEPDRVAEGRRRARPPRALDLADRVGPGRSEARLRAGRSRAESRPSVHDLRVRSSVTCTNGADVTLGARGCLESAPMSRRSTSPYRGGGLLRARHLTTLGLALGLALGATAIAVPAGATPQSDLAVEDGAGATSAGRRSTRTATAPTSSTSSTCRRRAQSRREPPDRQRRAVDRRGPEPGSRSCGRASAAAPHCSTWARAAATRSESTPRASRSSAPAPSTAKPRPRPTTG